MELTRICRAKLKEKEKQGLGGFISPEPKIYKEAIAIETVW